MNANELADELEVRYKHEECSECMLEAAAMLRQQQAKIEALKAQIASMDGLFNSLKGGDAKTVPLYTHPVKELTELTDGELEAIRKKAWKLADDATGNCISYSLEFRVIYDREFARAILRKAQEK